jgi:adenylate cyclase class 2
MQRRAVFLLPAGHEIKGGWLRVRDEGDKISMSLKVVDGESITDQKELYLEVSDYNEAVEFLKTIGCEEKAYQETKRELWRLGEVDITIDQWPFLEPLVEVEGESEQEVREVSEKIGFDWANARFVVVGTLYAEKYNISEDRINNHTPKIVFDMDNPFV